MDELEVFSNSKLNTYLDNRAIRYSYNIAPTIDHHGLCDRYLKEPIYCIELEEKFSGIYEHILYNSNQLTDIKNRVGDVFSYEGLRSRVYLLQKNSDFDHKKHGENNCLAFTYIRGSYFSYAVSPQIVGIGSNGQYIYNSRGISNGTFEDKTYPHLLGRKTELPSYVNEVLYNYMMGNEIELRNRQVTLKSTLLYYLHRCGPRVSQDIFIGLIDSL